MTDLSNISKSTLLVLFATFALVLNQAHMSRADLLGFYSFDNAADQLNDDSNNGADLTQPGGAANPTHGAGIGFEGGAFSFDGGDRLFAPIDINPGTLPQMTMGAWVQTNVLTGLGKVLGSDDGGGDRTIGLDYRGNNFAGGFGDRYSAFTGVGGAPGGLIESPVVDFAPTGTGVNDWSFVAVTYDQAGTTAIMYADIDANTSADALKSFTKSPTALGGTSQTNITIGALNPGGGEAWLGKIDNVFIFDSALTTPQLTAIRNGGIAELQHIRDSITLVDPVINDGSFESNTVDTNNVVTNPLTLPSGMTVTETIQGGVLMTFPAGPHITNFSSNGVDAMFNDDGTTSVTTVDLLGTNGYSSVSAGDAFDWSFDFNSFGNLSTAEVQLLFGGAAVSLGTQTTDGDINTPHATIFGTYIATVADAANVLSGDGALRMRALLTDVNGNIYGDNLRLSVTVVPEPNTLALSAVILLSLGLVGWRRRTRA